MKGDKHDCLACKVISIGCLLGLGCYMFKLGITSTRKSKMTYNALGTGLLGLGIGEIFNVSPFRKKTID